MYEQDYHEPVTPGGSASRVGEMRRDSARDSHVIALLLHRVTRARIATAVGRRHALVFVTSVEELANAVRECPRVRTVICEPRDAHGIPTAPVLHDLRASYPSFALIGYCPRGTASPDLLALANAGIDELVQEGLDDEGAALRAAYRGSIEACAARQVLAAVKDVIPTPLLPVAQYCLRFPREDHSVGGLARAQGVDRKTLLNHSHRNDFIAPSTLAMWCRILLAAALLEATRETVEQVSYSLEFSSPSSFRNACSRYTGVKPSAWRQAGGLSGVVALFLRALRDRPK